MLPPTAALSSSSTSVVPASAPTFVPAPLGYTAGGVRPSVSAAHGGPAFNPWDLLRALQRRWQLALVLGLIIAGVTLGWAYYLLQQPQYRYATALAYMWPVQPHKIYKPEPESEWAITSRMKNEVAIVASEAVIRRAASDPDLLGNPDVADFAALQEDERYAWIAGHCGAFANPKDFTISIVVNGALNEKWLVPIANAMLRSYVQESNAREMAEREARYEQRHQVYMEHGGQLDAELAQLLEKQRELGADIPYQYQLMVKSLDDLKNDRAARTAKIVQLEIQKDAEIKYLGDLSITEDQVEAKLNEDEMLIQLWLDCRALETTIQNEIGRFNKGAESPSVKAAMRELANMKDQFHDYLELLTADIRASLELERDGKIQRATEELQKKIFLEQSFVDRLDAEIERREADVKEYANSLIDTRDVEERIKDYPSLPALREELRVLETERGAPPRVCEKDAAATTTVDTLPSPVKNIALGGMGALALMLAGVAFLEYRSRRIHNADEVVQGLGMRLLGAIPSWAPADRQRGSYGGAITYNIWTESVDTARTLVTHAAQAEAARVVMITSATSGEGKTSLAGHLAGSLARAGHRTLLVDGDLRSPALHALFELPQAPGLCEILRGQTGVDQAIQSTPARHLFILTAGQCDGDALQALAQGGARDIFAKLKQSFDYVIVDSSPVLAVADALLLGRHADGVLMSILRDVSRVPTVQAAYQRLNMLGIRTLGAVVNGTRQEQYGSWYNSSPSAA